MINNWYNFHNLCLKKVLEFKKEIRITYIDSIVIVKILYFAVFIHFQLIKKKKKLSQPTCMRM